MLDGGPLQLIEVIGDPLFVPEDHGIEPRLSNPAC